VTSGRFLREDELAVRHDLETSTFGFDQLDLDIIEMVFQDSRQTDGFGPVVSHDAEFDRDLHARSFPLGFGPYVRPTPRADQVVGAVMAP